jgi:hypothetical protein
LSFQLHFGCKTTITGGEVLAAAVTQHTLQISIQHKHLQNMSKEHLMKHCVDLQALHTDKQTGESDIDGLQMMEELDVLSVLVKSKRPTVRSTAVNFAVALPNIFTLPMPVASGEMSFSLLKLIKTLPDVLYVTRTIVWFCNDSH